MSSIKYPDVPEEDWNTDRRTDSGTGPPDRTRWYGVFRTKSGLSYFVVKAKKSIPATAVVTETTDVPAEAIGKAKAMLKEWWFTKDEPGGSSTVRILPCSVVIHSDGQRTHSGVVLETDDVTAKLVFTTSNPTWNPQARPMTDDEQAMTGFSVRGRSYFAPVVRPVEDLSPLGRFFPEHRVAELLAEFVWDDLELFVPDVYEVPGVAVHVRLREHLADGLRHPDDGAFVHARVTECPRQNAVRNVRHLVRLIHLKEPVPELLGLGRHVLFET